MESNFVYFSRRASEEHRAAAAAQTPAARAAHYELARRHRLMAQLFREPAPVALGAIAAANRETAATLESQPA